jgi:outer membrane protein TolC
LWWISARVSRQVAAGRLRIGAIVVIVVVTRDSRRGPALHYPAGPPDRLMHGATTRSDERSPRRSRTGRAPRRCPALRILPVALAFLAGCGLLPFPATRDPYAAAPASPAAPWRPPPRVVAERPPALAGRPDGEALVDPGKVYELPDLIDLAQRINPETRRAWEQARSAAARLGQAEGAWFPTLVAAAAAGGQKVADRTTAGVVDIEGPQAAPRLTLSWLLLDFGRRRAAIEGAGQRVLAANFAFTRKHQDIAFAVSRSFYAFDASRARVVAARVNLEAAAVVAEAVQARLDQGLATRPELLLALQERARAAYEVQDAAGLIEDARALLAESLGISPVVPLRVVELGGVSLPAGLEQSVEQVIDRTLARRPDLAARLAELRAREAEVNQARARFSPRLNLSGAAGGDLGRYRASPPSRSFDVSEFVYGGFLSFEWTLFDGFERDNVLRDATARRGAAEAELVALELRAIREVWKAYADVKTALGKREFALALLAASEEAYAATLESYRSAGLATVLDLLAAQRDLARARFIEIESRADLLQASAALVHSAGD